MEARLGLWKKGCNQVKLQPYWRQEYLCSSRRPRNCSTSNGRRSLSAPCTNPFHLHDSLCIWYYYPHLIDKD